MVRAGVGTYHSNSGLKTVRTLAKTTRASWKTTDVSRHISSGGLLIRLSRDSRNEATAVARKAESSVLSRAVRLAPRTHGDQPSIYEDIKRLAPEAFIKAGSQAAQPLLVPGRQIVSGGVEIDGRIHQDGDLQGVSFELEG